MAGDWIKVQICTPDKPEVHRMAEMLEIDPDAVTGKLLRIWIWADQQTIDGNASSVTKSLLDRITAVSGFAESMLQVGWLEQSENGFCFPNFARHNGQTAKTRASAAKRVEKHRKNAVSPEDSCNALGVTEALTTALPEKRREEKSKNKTQEFIFPSDLDTPEFRAAWTDWKQFRKEIKHGLTAKTIEAQMNKFAKWGLAKSIAAIRKSIENGWQGLFEPTEGPAAVNGSASIEDDWDEVKAIVLEKYHPDVRCTKRIEQLLTPEQFKAVIEVSPRKIWDSDRFDKVVPAAYRRARNRVET
jgi:hypothetical protein